MEAEIKKYNQKQLPEDQKICNLLMEVINNNLPGSTSKIWHGSPVWFLDGNPTVGYNKQKAGLKLVFWSGADFKDKKLKPGSGKFKDASIVYNALGEVDIADLKAWLKKATEIQWDYKNIIKHKGVLLKFKS